MYQRCGLYRLLTSPAKQDSIWKTPDNALTVQAASGNCNAELCRLRKGPHLHRRKKASLKLLCHRASGGAANVLLHSAPSASPLCLLHIAGTGMKDICAPDRSLLMKIMRAAHGRGGGGIKILPHACSSATLGFVPSMIARIRQP